MHNIDMLLTWCIHGIFIYTYIYTYTHFFHRIYAQNILNIHTEYMHRIYDILFAYYACKITYTSYLQRILFALYIYTNNISIIYI
jgi:hypothetical protein